MKREWGCEKDILPFDFFDEELTRCPRRLHLDNPTLIAEALQHYSWYKTGHLPAAGTWLDQSTQFVSLVETINAAVSTVERELTRK